MTMNDISNKGKNFLAILIKISSTLDGIFFPKKLSVLSWAGICSITMLRKIILKMMRIPKKIQMSINLRLLVCGSFAAIVRLRVTRTSSAVIPTGMLVLKCSFLKYTVDYKTQCM